MNSEYDDEIEMPSPGMQALEESEAVDPETGETPEFVHTESILSELDDRTYLRSIALQALYETDLSGHSIEAVLGSRFEAVELINAQKAVVYKLATGVLAHQSEIDALIVKHAPDWPLDKIAVVDRNIMRIAIYEFAVDGTTPREVAINEAVELAKIFCLESSPRFINAVLHAVADEIAR